MTRPQFLSVVHTQVKLLLSFWQNWYLPLIIFVLMHISLIKHLIITCALIQQMARLLCRNNTCIIKKCAAYSVNTWVLFRYSSLSQQIPSVISLCRYCPKSKLQCELTCECCVFKSNQISNSSQACLKNLKSNQSACK